MSWQTFRITDSIQAYRVSHELMEGLFGALTVWATSGRPTPTDVGIFSRLNLEDGSTDYFFSPRAVEIAGHLAKRYSAEPCEIPTRESGAGLLAGDQRALDLLPLK